ncbi:MAG: ATP-dependent DNA helicase RecG, partial [Dehalococcoidales bacterium]|nr:ATP-dependent DNA helicase RecG [Dehalococcoidales bacterium]
NKPSVLKKFKQLQLDKGSYSQLDKEQRKTKIDQILAFVDEYEALPLKKMTKPPESAPVQVVKSKRKPSLKTAQGLDLNASITTIKGVSTAVAAKFNKLGAATIRDLLYYFPYRHLDYSQRKTISELNTGVEETIIANVWQVREVRLGNRRSTEAIVGDETGNVRVVWFNNPYIVKQLSTNQQIVISGRINIFKDQPVFESPEWEVLEDKELVHTGRLVPLYPLTKGLYPRTVRKMMKGVIDRWSPEIAEFLPQLLRTRCKLLDLPQAISQAHFPDSLDLKDRARIRLAFDELFLLQLGALARKRRWQISQPANPFKINTALLDKWMQTLPFKFTAAQEKVTTEILEDLKKTVPMSRLLQGEVGSGKTVVAMASLIAAVDNGFQGAFMAPTEILAGQHFASICNLLAMGGQALSKKDYLHTYSGVLNKPLTIALLIGDIKGKKKQELQKAIASGEVDIVIGTHALIQKDVDFKSLGLVIVDEQHRFGVTQRSALRKKGFSPHVLVMTATPIPRTLALTLYGDLDLSVIDQLPPGRQTIKTKWLTPQERAKAYNFIRKQVAEGRQAFIICPLIEESEAVQARAATGEFEYLSAEVFPSLRLGLLHGRMSSADKDDVMSRFRSGELDILVSTAVVEVGVDIPNATVMMIESADRFGLSQLHQFRGRVGRGKEQSYCMLLAENPSEIAKNRLEIIESVQDGFLLAEEDLKLRGPGEFFGTRQSGIPDLRMARISDTALLEMARREANLLFEKDPGLKEEEHKLLSDEISRFWAKKDIAEQS